MADNPLQGRRKEKSQSLSPPQTEERPHLIRKILASWWGRLLAILAAIGVIVGSADIYDRLFPDIHALSNSSAPTDFFVGNNAPIFDMKNVVLVCDVENAMFKTDKGPVGFSLPITSGVVNTAIPHGDLATYPCDASQFMKMADGKLCLLTLCTANMGISQISIAKETLKIGMRYTILGVPFDFLSEAFTWDGHSWHKGPALR